jgi:hypothetical protein
MVDSDLGSLASPIKDAIFGGAKDTATSGGGGSGIIWVIGIILGVLIISVTITFIWFFFYEKKKWNIITRVHYENPNINGISFGNGIPTRRIRFKDGRVVYLYKTPIQGYTISPELLVWTRPKEHDVIVTQDKKLFCLVGIENIDIKRKKLNVDISHPDIEMDRQDLQQHIDSKKFDDPNEKLKLIAKVATWIFVLTTIIVISILAGKYYIDSKNIELERDKINLQISEQQKDVMESVNTFTKLLENNLNIKPTQISSINSNTGETG